MISFDTCSTHGHGGATTREWASAIANASLLNDSGKIWWQSAGFGSALRTLLRQAQKGKSNFTVATLGGSASAFRPNLGDFLRGHLDVDLGGTTNASRAHSFNPSHGYSGSDWGALFMDSLVPPDTDLLIWEFAINDCHSAGSNARDRTGSPRLVFY